jgi:hypothetical protein
MNENVAGILAAAEDMDVIELSMVLGVIMTVLNKRLGTEKLRGAVNDALAVLPHVPKP